MPWNNIANGQHPDGDKLMQNFNYRFQADTFANLKATAKTNPTILFIGFATDTKTAFLYTGDITVGDEGFITLGGGTW